MEKITIKGKEYLRFKIGDEFEYISGKGSFNKMKKEGLASDEYDEEKGFIYPFYDGSTLNNHVKGYSKKSNYLGKGIKVSKDGDAGVSILIDKNIWNGDHSFILKSKNLSNYYCSLFFNNFLPPLKEGTTIPSVKFSSFQNEYITIPANHQELSKVIKRVLEYKQLSKQLSKQLKEYKEAILQLSSKEIAKHKANGNHDKYIEFKIGDEFECISGKGSFNKMKKEGLASDEYDEEKGFIYPAYDASHSSLKSKGFSKIFDFNGSFIKVSIAGNSGKTTFLEKGKYKNLENSDFLFSKNFCNHFLSLFFNKFLPSFKQGTAMTKTLFSYYKNKRISIPANHQELSKVIKKINDWEIEVNKTTKKMEDYIEGVLQYSLKGVLGK